MTGDNVLRIAFLVFLVAVLPLPKSCAQAAGGGTDGQGGPQAGSLYRIYPTDRVYPIYRQRYRFIRRIPPSYYQTVPRAQFNR